MSNKPRTIRRGTERTRTRGAVYFTWWLPTVRRAAAMAGQWSAMQQCDTRRATGQWQEPLPVSLCARERHETNRNRAPLGHPGGRLLDDR